MIKKELKTLLLCLLVAISMGMILYYGSCKEGYHVDEYYSYGLANSEYLPFLHFGDMEYSVKDWMKEYGAGESLLELAGNLISDFRILRQEGFQIRSSVIYQDYLRAQANSADTHTTTWLSGDYYREYLSAGGTNRFNYASVYYNQRGDVHPPLFYLALHTLCSFFPGVFSKWFGISLNMLYTALTILILWRIVKKYLGGKWLALAVTAVYAVSVYMVSAAVFIRMYALLTLMTLWCLENHLELAQNEYVIDKKIGRRLALSVLLGFLTHYYFVLYVLALAGVTFLQMLFHKRGKCALRYVLLMAGTALAGLVIWPFAIKHVFFGYRGQSSLFVLSRLQLNLGSIRAMGRMILQMIWGGHPVIAWSISLLLPAVAVILTVVSGKQAGVEKRIRFPMGKLLLLVVPVVFYICFVSQIVPITDDRYICNTYPFFCILTVCGAGFVGRAAETVWKDRFKLRIFLPGICCVVLILLGNGLTHEPRYLYKGGQETIEVPERCVCIFVLPDDDWNESTNECNVLARCEQVAVIYESDLEQLRGTYRYEPGQHVMIAVQDELDTEEILQKVKSVLELTELEEEGRNDTANSVKVILSKAP